MMKVFVKLICLFTLCLLIRGGAFAAENYPIKMKTVIRLDDKGQSKIPPSSAATAASTTTAPAPAPEKEAPKETGPSVTFEGEKFTLGYSARDNAGMWLNEYFRPGDNNFSTWKRLIGVYYYEGINITPQQVAQSMIDNLQKTNPSARYGVTQNSKTGEIMLDFFTWTPDNSVVEFNAFKIGKSGGSTISMQFARRWYDEDGSGAQQEFMQNFKTQRPGWLEELRRTPFPAPVKTAKK